MVELDAPIAVIPIPWTLEKHNDAERRAKNSRVKGCEQMAKKSEITGGKGAAAEQRGTPGKAPLHEGPAGGGAVTKSKFSKETRDSVGEKEPQKSRGASEG